ncbi:hypothetical protein [Nocardiopsis oceani]
MARNELVRGRDSEDTRDRRTHTFADYLRPWLAAPALVPAGFLTHWMWGDLGLGTGLAAAAIAAAGGVVTYAAHKLTGARTWYAHHISTAMTGGAAAWLALATAFGPGRPLMDMLLIGGWAAAAIANVHLWARAQGALEDGAPKWTRPSWVKVSEKLGLRGVKMRVTKETDTITTGRLEFDDGRTVEDVQHRRKELASMYRVAPGAVRITEHPERADWGEITIITKNVMKELVPWPGLDPKLTGASIADAPVGPLGVYEDGMPFDDELDDRHTLTVGMSGSGKSVYGKIKLVSIAARRDTFVCAIDLSKGRQTLGPVDRAIGWTAFDKKSAKAMLAAIKRAVTARADHLGSKGLPGWTKGCGLSFLHILIEEAADLVDFDELVELGRAARSAGIHLEISLQRATFGNIDTDARANFGDSISFGVKTDGDASFALPDYVLEAGAEPQRWMANQPGSAYAAVRRAEVERHATPIKMFGPPTTSKSDENLVLTPAAESLPDQDSKLDPITRAAFGTVYAEFVAARVGAPVVATATADVEEIEDQEHDDNEDLAVDDDLEPIVLTTPDDDPEIVGDIDAEIPRLEDDEDFVLPTRKKGTKASAEEARAALESLVEEWGPGREFGAFEAKTELREMGVERGKSWLYGQLRRLEDDGRLRHEDSGSWTILETRELIDA